MRHQRVLVQVHRQQPPVDLEGVLRRARRQDRGLARSTCAPPRTGRTRVAPRRCRGGRRSARRGGPARSSSPAGSGAPAGPARPRRSPRCRRRTRAADRSGSARCRPATPPPPARRVAWASIYHPLVQGWDGVRTDQHRASRTQILGLAALVDLLTGIVLSVIGVSQDKQELAIVGVVLLHRRCRDARLRGLDAEQARTAVSSFVLYGAGAVGGVIGSRLSLAGHDVTLVARGEHLARILADGLVLDTGEGRHAVRAPATDTAAGVEWRDDTVVVLAVKSHQTEAALADLVRHAPGTVPVVCAQNGVSNEPATLRTVRSHVCDHGDAAVAAPRAGRRRPELPPGAGHPRHRPLPVRHRPGDRSRGRRPALGRLRVGAAARHHGVEVPQAGHQRRGRRLHRAARRGRRAQATRPCRGRGGPRRRRRTDGEPRGRPRAPRRPAPGSPRRRRARTRWARASSAGPRAPRSTSGPARSCCSAACTASRPRPTSWSSGPLTHWQGISNFDERYLFPR